jgi:hypothetical protein
MAFVNDVQNSSPFEQLFFNFFLLNLLRRFIGSFASFKDINKVCMKKKIHDSFI